MKGIRTAIANMVYRGPTADIGDLWCGRVEPGLIVSVWQLDDEERKLIAAGGNVVLWIYAEPIPPVALEVRDEKEFTEQIGEHRFKVIPELEDAERR